MDLSQYITLEKLTLTPELRAKLKSTYAATGYAAFNDLIITASPIGQTLTIHPITEIINQTAQALEESRLGEADYLEELFRHVSVARDELQRGNNLESAQRDYFIMHRNGAGEFGAVETEVADFSQALRAWGDLVAACDSGYQLAVRTHASKSSATPNCWYYKNDLELSKDCIRCLKPHLDDLLGGGL